MKLRKISRFFKHLVSNPWQVRHHFSKQALQTIEQAITASEKKHTGEMRFAVEAGLHPYEIICKKAPRERAIELFSQLKIWDTEKNNGVLIYLLLADRDVEIVADRGIDRHVGHDGWDVICHEMELMFRRGEFEAGILYGIEKIGLVLEKHSSIKKIKKPRAKRNELPDQPVLL